MGAGRPAADAPCGSDDRLGRVGSDLTGLAEGGDVGLAQFERPAQTSVRGEVRIPPARIVPQIISDRSHIASIAAATVRDGDRYNVHTRP